MNTYWQIILIPFAVQLCYNYYNHCYFIDRRVEEKRMLKSVKSLVVMAVMALTFGASNVSATTGDFGVGTGTEEWGENIVAPYVDMTAWVAGDLGDRGVLNLAKVSEESGLKYFNLGFIQTVAVEEDRVDWGWGGFKVLSEGSTHGQYNAIKTAIKNLRDGGGDVAVSFGGAAGYPFWLMTQDVDKLYNTYTEIVTGYGLTRIDLDIEGGASGYAHNVANAQAIKRLQDATGVDVSLTLPVMPFGLTYIGLDVVKAYLENGVDIATVNLMTMCYGSSVPDYAQGSVEAVDSTKAQLQRLFSDIKGVELSDSDAYKMLGTTPSVGFESAGHPYFTPEMTKQVVEHAKEKNIGMVSFWSLNRDAMVDGGIGQIQNKYEHTNEILKFSDTATPPEPEPEANAWRLGGRYTAGEIVTHNGKTYKVWQSHINYGDPNWAPDIALSLFYQIY